MRLDISRLVNVKRQSDGSIQCQCPICFGENGRDKAGKNHLRVYRSGAFSCVVDNSREHNGKIKAYLCNTAPSDNPDTEWIDPEPTVKVDKVYPENSLSTLLDDQSYWESRGIRADVARRLGAGVAVRSEKSKLSGRSVFPLRGIDRRIIGFAARLIEDNSFAPKWKILGRKSTAIFPSVDISERAIIDASQVILVEGVGCVAALGAADVWNTMCLFGLNISSKQLTYLLSLNVRRIIIATNNEDSGIGNDAARKLENRLRAFWSDENVIVHLPLAKDFMDMTPEQMGQWISKLKRIGT